jgi:hypothetical protein
VCPMRAQIPQLGNDLHTSAEFNVTVCALPDRYLAMHLDQLTGCFL